MTAFSSLVQSRRRYRFTTKQCKAVANRLSLLFFELIRTLASSCAALQSKEQASNCFVTVSILSSSPEHSLKSAVLKPIGCMHVHTSSFQSRNLHCCLCPQIQNKEISWFSWICDASEERSHWCKLNSCCPPQMPLFEASTFAVIHPGSRHYITEFISSSFLQWFLSRMYKTSFTVSYPCRLVLSWKFCGSL